MRRSVLQKSAQQDSPRGRLDPDGFRKHVDFQTFSPPAELTPFVEHFWLIRSKAETLSYSSEQLMHRPYVDLFIAPGASGIQGTFCAKRVYDGTAYGSPIIGVRFCPGAFHLFYSGKMTDLRDTVMNFDTVFPEIDCSQLLKQPSQEALRELADILSARVPNKDRNIEYIQEIIEAVEADETLQTVTDVAKRFGKSERWLQKLFQEYVGVGLKGFLQTRRLLATAGRIRSGVDDWARLAYDCGYSSQQHFISDFKRVLGKTPRRYKMELDGQLTNH